MWAGLIASQSFCNVNRGFIKIITTPLNDIMHFLTDFHNNEVLTGREPAATMGSYWSLVFGDE